MFFVDVIRNNWKYEEYFRNFYIIYKQTVPSWRISWEDFFPCLQTVPL